MDIAKNNKKETEEYFAFENIPCKYDNDKAFCLLDKYKDNLFTAELISDEEAEMLYYTILDWKYKADVYDNL